ncbi:acyltransferase [Alcaligenes faecalis]|uniref:Acyltransferase n=1 Tax=Alcaligenes ammonioxydans TaxID=2582914 RepID=A0ABX8SW42_9BURK|nr:acyltransferase family protein [Alcaligenes ammonioxydans]QXX80246.1 acyltransferase [Alcaligenes ammonioxydans]
MMKYRSDIDGLRALAVLSVLIFHLNSDWLPGGFIGVDVFFVISGFLISHIIKNEVMQGRFSFFDFYKRRIRRILPPLYIVLLFSLLAGFFLLLPEDFDRLFSSVLYSSAFLANQFFSKDGGYFDIASDEKPLLHIWSLSIEEQFYFIWPLVFLLAFRFFSRRGKDTLDLSLTVFVTCGVALGFAYSQYYLLSTHAGDSVYFLLRLRFSELLVGALFAFLPVYSHRRGCHLLQLTGIMLIVGGLLMLDKQSVFPGLNALIPCLGAGLFIYGGRSEQATGGWVMWVFQRPYMVAVGLISYSLYLWHWPILAYLRYVYGAYVLPLSWLLVAVPCMFILAYLSYRLVEQRCKRWNVGFTTAFLALFLLPALALAGLGLGLKAVKPSLDLDPALLSYGTDVCHGTFDKRCLRGDPEKSPRILVTGDSHAAALNSFVDEVGRKEGWQAYVVTGSSCSPVFGFNEHVLPESSREPCKNLKEYIATAYRQYEAVIFTSFWSYQLGEEPEAADPDYLSKLEHTLRSIAASTPVYVLSDVPELAVSPIRQELFSRLGIHIERAPGKKAQAANAIIKQIVDRIPNVYWVDVGAVARPFAEQGRYAGRMAYFDNNHLNVYGSTSLGQLFVQEGHHLLAPGRH